MTKKEILKLDTVQDFLKILNQYKSRNEDSFFANEAMLFGELKITVPANPKYAVSPFFVSNNQENNKIINWLEVTYGIDFQLDVNDPNRAQRTGASHKTFKVVIGEDEDLDIDEITGIEPKIVWRNKVIEIPTNDTSYILTANDLNAVCKAEGTITYSLTVGASLNVGRNNIVATFTPTDLVKYKVATKQISIKIVNL